MIAELLPPNVATSELELPVGADSLFPEEAALVARATPKRQAEFATARHCARLALAQLNVAPIPILTGPRREPLWPDAIVGSITHCAAYHAAAVGRTRDFRSIGIDAEPNEPLPDGVLELIAGPGERAQLRRRAEVCLDRVLFSAKESVYKAWFPLARRWLDFDDASIALHHDGTFDVHVSVAGPLRAARGRWLARDGRIATVLVLPG